jgi:pyrroline-5-carboxylate reductase
VHDYGFLGVGEIAAAIVTGLCEGVAAPPTILLSPRSRERSAALAARHPSVEAAEDNQAVLDGCAVAVLAIRPQDRALLGELRFRADQRVISLLAGVSHGELAPLVAPATEVARAIPMPPVARRAGVTPIFPATAAARELFAPLGEVIEVDDVAVLDAMSVTTGTMAAHIRYVAAIGHWLSRQGVPPEQASAYVAALFAGMAGTFAEDASDLDALARAHATAGGINERFAGLLADGGTFELVERSLDAVRDSLGR